MEELISKLFHFNSNLLNITTNTVQVHLRNIFSKMGVSSRTEAVTSAISQGWFSISTTNE